MSPCSRPFNLQPPFIKEAILFIAGARIAKIPLDAATPERNAKLRELKIWLLEVARMELPELEPVRATIQKRFWRRCDV